MIRHEIMHDVRIIPLDGRAAPRPNVRMLLGDSRGRWEGDTLVVDTTNFTDRTPFRGPPATTRQDIFTSERPARRRALHARRTPTRSVYRFTVDDPGDVGQAVVGRDDRCGRWTGPIFEYACHEGNYGLANILSAARVEERTAGGQTAP